MTTERDIRNQIEYAHDAGVAEGLAEGMEKAAKNLKALGIPDDTISKATGLSYEQLATL